MKRRNNHYTAERSAGAGSDYIATNAGAFAFYNIIPHIIPAVNGIVIR